MFPSIYIICTAGFAHKGVLNKDPTSWLDGARPPPRYISKYIWIKIATLYISDIWFGDKLLSDGDCQIILCGELYSKIKAGLHYIGNRFKLVRFRAQKLFFAFLIIL